MRALPPPISVHTVASVLACMRSHGVRVPWSGSMTYQGARLPQVDFLVLSLGHWLPLTPASSFPPPPHSSALLNHCFPNGDGGTLCGGLCGRVGKAVIWLWVMLGLINSTKSRPWRPGKGEILPLTSDLWHSGISACGPQHEMHVTSNSVSLDAKLTVSEAPSTQRLHRVYVMFLLISGQSTVVFKKVRPEGIM